MSEVVPRDETSRARQPFLSLGTPSAVLVLASVLFLWNVWGYDLWAPDEPYFAEGAREMVVDGQWAVPHVNGVVTTDKPPLFFWLIAVVSLPLGKVSSLTARLPSVLAALGTVALTLRMGRRLLGPRAGAWAGVLLATTYLFWDKARSSQIDALLCFLVMIALSAFEAHRSGTADGRRAGLLFWLASALAVLAKGPVGLLLPVGIALSTLAWDRQLRSWRGFAPIVGPLLFAGIVLGWMALATFGGHGEYSVWGAFREHALSRTIHGMHHAQPPWYYLEVLPVQLLPWSGLLPAALFVAARRRGAADRFLLAWALFVVLFFSISTEKRDLYILPAYPAFALLAGSLVVSLDAAKAPIARRWLTLPHALVACLIAVVGIAVPFLAARVAGFPTWRAALLGAVLVATGVASARAAFRGRTLPSLVRTAWGTSVAYLVVATLVLPALDPVKSARRFSRVVLRTTAASRLAGHDVVAFRLGNLPEAFSFYTDGVYLRETSDPAALAAHLSRPERVFAVADRSGLDELPKELRDRLVVLDGERLSRIEVAIVANGPAVPDGVP